MAKMTKKEEGSQSSSGEFSNPVNNSNGMFLAYILVLGKELTNEYQQT